MKIFTTVLIILAIALIIFNITLLDFNSPFEGNSIVAFIGIVSIFKGEAESPKGGNIVPFFSKIIAAVESAIAFAVFSLVLCASVKMKRDPS